MRTSTGEHTNHWHVRRVLIVGAAAAALLLAGLFIGAGRADASPAYPVVQEHEQPDGTVLQLRLWGDEHAHGWETVYGHTVVKNPDTGYWEYAMRDTSGNLARSGVVVAEGSPPAAPNLRLSSGAYNAAGGGISLTLAAPAWAGSDTDMLFLMVEFADLACAAGFRDAQFQNDLFGGGATGPGDLDDYFREISYGAFEVDGVVEGGTANTAGGDCYTAANNRAFYNDVDDDAKLLVAEAVLLADADGVDFAPYDNDGDGDVDVIGIIYAGGGVFDGCGTSSGVDDLWPHSSGLGGAAVVVDGVTVDRYIIQSSVTSTAGTSSCDQRMTIGLFAHEMGHSLGIADQYDVDGGSEGIGFWGAMGSQFLSTVNLADTPSHYGPWDKWFLGWITPDDKTGFVGNGPIDQVEDAGYVIQLGANPGGPEHPGTGEYFLIENRQLVGFDSQLPGCGLVIWHIDEVLDHNKNAGHTVASHSWTDVEEADGNDDLDDDVNGNRGDAGDPYPGTSNNTVFNGTGKPHSNYYDDSPSGFDVSAISDCGAVMTANFGDPNADLSISKFDSPDPVVAGEQLTYSITVHNDGPGTATNVTVVDVLPDALSYVADTDSCVEAPAQTLTCDLGQMLSGESVSFSILTNVDPDYVADKGGGAGITNTGTVSADQPDGNLIDNEDSASTIIIDSADLRVSKDCKPDGPMPSGDTATCTITVENLGPSTARDVTMRDEHVSNGTFTISNVSPGASCGATPNPQVLSGQVNCSFGDLLAGSFTTVTFDITADDGQDINDEATVSSPTPDPDFSNNVATDSIIVEGSADLGIAKSDSPDPVVAGEQLTYTLTVSNSGPSTAVNVLVSDAVPAGVTVDSVSATGGGSCNAGVPGDDAQPSTCALDSMASGDVEIMTVVVTVLPQTTGLLQNDASVSSDTQDDNNANNLATETTTVATEADLVLVKVDAPDPVVAGTQLSYTITVTNNGPSTALDVEVTDTLPAGVSFLSAVVDDGVGTCEFLPLVTVSCTALADLDPGDFVHIYIDVLVDPSVPDGSSLFNTGTVSSSTTDPIPGNNTAVEETTVAAEADLLLEKDSNFETGNASTTIIYQIIVTNLGPSDAQNVEIFDDLPSILKGKNKEKVIFVFATEGCTYDPEPAGDHSVTCVVGTLAAGASAIVEIHIQVEGNSGVLTNTATASSTTTDPDPSNNVDVEDVTVSGGSDRPGGPPPGRGRPS